MPDTTVYDTLSVSERPQRVSIPSIKYPLRLLQADVSGEVVLSFIVDAKGRTEPTSIRVLCATDPAFRPPAIQAVRDATFLPGRLNGRPVRVRVTAPLKFVVSQPAPACDPTPRDS